MHITRESFKFVPNQDFSQIWNDNLLFAKYALSDNEISLIKNTIRSMGSNMEGVSDE